MLFVCIALWIIGAVLLYSDPRKVSTRWLSALAFTGGFGGLSVVLDETIEPFAAAYFHNTTLNSVLYALEIVSSLLSYFGVPYTFALFAVANTTNSATYRWLRVLAYTLALPIGAMFLLRPIYPIHYAIVALWATPYVLFGCFLLLYTNEINSTLKRSRFFTNLAVIPTVLFCLIMNYILPSFGKYEMWRYNVGVIAFAFVVFIIAIFKFGFMGIQIRIQRQQLDHTLRAITSGTAILNHAIKNDVGKMKLFCEKMKLYAEQTAQAELAEDVQVVASASQHIQEMILRVHDQTQDMILKMSLNTLSEIADQTLQLIRPSLRNVSVQSQYQREYELLCDRAQVAETFHNVFMNAAEAMPNGGELLVKLYDTKKHVIVEVKDTGTGIKKQHMKQVMEPFFTTKGNSIHNFGLGLAYCYNVMRKHGGSLEIQSQPNLGTTVFLRFPKVHKS